MGYIIGKKVKGAACEYCGYSLNKCNTIHFTNDDEVEYNSQILCHDCIQSRLINPGNITPIIRKMATAQICPLCGSEVTEKIVYTGVNLSETSMKEAKKLPPDEIYCKKCMVKSAKDEAVRIS